jgi:hypothetical protein
LDGGLFVVGSLSGSQNASELGVDVGVACKLHAVPESVWSGGGPTVVVVAGEVVTGGVVAGGVVAGGVVAGGVVAGEVVAAVGEGLTGAVVVELVVGVDDVDPCLQARAPGAFLL